MDIAHLLESERSVDHRLECTRFQGSHVTCVPVIKTTGVPMAQSS
jgi:hypothetical protein